MKVTSEQLASLFNVHVANVLIRPYNHLAKHLVDDQRTSYEAWIIHVGDRQETRKLAERINGRGLGDTIIRCEAIVEQVKLFELCEKFQNGKCEHSISCNMKHVLCAQSDACSNPKCWYGHSSFRKTVSQRRPTSDEDGYRIRISGLPLNVTPIEILKRLDLHFVNIGDNLCLRKESTSSPRTIAYLIDQKSRYLVQELIHRWHNEIFSTKSTDKIHCQLELNVDYFDYFLQVPLPSMSMSGSQTSRPSNTSSKRDLYRKLPVRTTTAIVINNNDKIRHDVSSANNELEQIKLPSPWRSTNKRLWGSKNDDTLAIYHVANKRDQQKNAALLVYSAVSDRTLRLRLQHGQTVLEQLKEVDGVLKIIDSNFNKVEGWNANLKSSTKFWILMDLMATTTLSDLIDQRTLCVREILMIILKLVDLIKQIHNRNVVHRNISPRNVLINYDSSMSPDQIYVGLIDFNCAWIEQSNKNLSNSDQGKELTANDFYQVPQFDIQPSNTNVAEDNLEQIELDRRSRTIDTSFICAILFWMITGCEPKCSRNENGQAPHQLNGIQEMIYKKFISEADEYSTTLFQRHLKLVFDRGFANCKQQWPVVELDYQLRFMLELITNTKNPIDSLRVSLINTTSFNVSTESFIRFISFIDKIKNEFVNRYASIESIHWMNDNNWSGDIQTVRNYNTLVIRQSRLSIKFELIRHNNSNKIQLSIHIRINDTTIIELPIGIYQENMIENELDNIVNNIVVEFKTFYVIHSNFEGK